MPRKPRLKKQKIQHHNYAPSDVCINDVIPMEDLIYKIMSHLNALDLFHLQQTCKLYQTLICPKHFKRFLYLSEKDTVILNFEFENEIPYHKFAISKQTIRCVECCKRQYCFLFDHLPQFYVCRNCSSTVFWLRNVCKSRKEGEYFLTPSVVKKYDLELNSFFVTNPHYKSASEMQLFWELEVKYYAYQIFGGKEGFHAETEKRRIKREKMAITRLKNQKNKPKKVHRGSNWFDYYW
jgi:hypothetical protein